jgi:hypothetical protein
VSVAILALTLFLPQRDRSYCVERLCGGERE